MSLSGTSTLRSARLFVVQVARAEKGSRVKKKSLANVRSFQCARTTRAEYAPRRRGLGCSAPIERFAERKDKKDKHRR